MANSNGHQRNTLPHVFSLVERLQKKLDNVQRQTVREVGLTPPQFATLTQLWAEDGQPLKDLAAGNGCTPATMTTIVDGLERKGLVARRPHPEDRRSVLVHTTADGARMEGSAPSLSEMFAGCCSGLSPDETRTLAGLLTKLDGALAGWAVERPDEIKKESA